MGIPAGAAEIFIAKSLKAAEKSLKSKKIITEKDLVFYKVYEDLKQVIIYAVTDQRQDYMKILNGM